MGRIRTRARRLSMETIALFQIIGYRAQCGDEPRRFSFLT